MGVSVSAMSPFRSETEADLADPAYAAALENLHRVLSEGLLSE